MKTLRLLVATVILVILSSCQNPLGGLVASKTNTEKQIEALKTEFAATLEAQTDQVETAKNAVIAAQKEQMRAAANSFYSLDLLYGTLTTPLRTDLIWHNYTLEGWTALGRQMPDYETMLAANERLKKELDESRTSTADLQRTHAAVLAVNQQLVDATKQWQDKVKAAEDALNTIKDEYTAKITAKQGELVAIQNKLIAAEKARADDAAAIQALKTKISTVCGVIVLACMAGAIWSPLAKRQLIISGVAAGLAGAAIWVIPGWVVVAAVVLMAGVLVFTVLRNHRKDEKALDGLVLGIEDIKTQAPEKWEEIKGFVEERLKKYVKGADGKAVAVPDPALDKHIDAKLVEWDAK